MPDSQPDVSELAREVVDELKDTRQIGDQLLLSRREAIALSTGAVSLGALGVAGAGTASAQEAAGQIGTASDPVDVEGAQGNFSQGVSVDGALEAEQTSIRQLAGSLRTDASGSAQEIPNDTDTQVEFTTVNREDNAVVDVRLDSDDMQILEGGLYQIYGRVYWDDNSNWSVGDRIDTRIVVNGSARSIDRSLSAGSELQTSDVFELTELEANDVISMAVRQDSGGSIQLRQDSSGGIERFRFEVVKIA